MNNFGIAPSFASLLLFNSAHADPVPAPLKSMLQSKKSVIPSAELTAEERDFLWQDTKVDRRGYIRTVASPEYVKMVDNFSIHPRFKKSLGKEKKGAVRNDNLSFVGELVEDRYRSTYVFAWGKTQIGLTVFNISQAGVRAVVVEEFLKQKVGDSPATLALSVAKGKGRGMWKLGWIKAGLDYELWVPDELDLNDDPFLDSSSVMEIASTLQDYVTKSPNTTGR